MQNTLVIFFIFTLMLVHSRHIYHKDERENSRTVSRTLNHEKRPRKSKLQNQGSENIWAGNRKHSITFSRNLEDFSPNFDSRIIQYHSRNKNSSIFISSMKFSASKKSYPSSYEKRLSHNSKQQLESNRTKLSRVDLSSKQKRSSRQRRAATTGSNDTLICHGELSCRNRCHNPRTVLHQTKLSCYCDVDCEFFQDCCADYDDFCSTNLDNTTVNNTTVNGQGTKHNASQENLVNQHNRDLWRCYQGEKLLGTKGVWMIGSCPKSWPKDHVFYQCRNLSEANKITKDNYRYLPVYTDNGRVYHNRFCAECNGVSSKDMKNFSLSIQCEFSPPKHLSFDSKISYLFSYCQRQTNKIFWTPNKGDPRRYCIDITSVDSCASSVCLPLHLNITKTKCISGKTRVVTSGFFYKNTHCAKCALKCEISCGPNITKAYGERQIFGFLDPPKPFSMIFDFNNDANQRLTQIQILKSCSSTKIYDPYLDTCRDTVPSLPRFSYFNQYQIFLWLLPDLKDVQEIEVRQAIAQTLGISIKHVTDIEMEGTLLFTLQIRQNESLRASAQNYLYFTSPFNITIARQVFTVVKATKRILSCFHWQKFYRDEYTVLQDGTSAVSIKKTGVIFKSTDYYINTTSTANESQAIFVCHQHQLSNCSGVFILMNSNEFTLLHNRSIIVNASKQVYDWSEYIWQNNSVLVCVNFSKHYYETKIELNDDPLLSMMTIVCMSLSIAGLVFVLVTYSLFSELRTPPGINLMNLSVSILLAQLLWLLGSGQTDTPMACTVIAVILHYLFLVSFMWTSIIAFDTWRAFSAKGRRPLDESRYQRMRLCLRYMAVGWLSVMVYVAICVVLDFTDTVDIGYTSERGCWMGNRWAILYSFGIPISSFLVFNIVFCFITFRAINVTTAQARAASDHDTRKNFGIYLRIASLMGFTWIFGFAAPFVGQFMWYPFVILNSLQGVYTALAFALNKRARSLYTRLFTGKSSSYESSNTSISKTRMKGSEYTNEGYDESRL